jgi:hypothetical protein
MTQPPLDLAQLERALRSVDPAVCLAPSRILRRVIKKDRQIVGLGLRVPHAKSYVIRRDTLLKYATREELNLPADRELPEIVILLVAPEASKLADSNNDDILTRYWRLLFHARVHLALDERIAEGRLSVAGVRHRIQQLGQAEFDAARVVLDEEDYLLAPRDDRSSWIEFAAVYLELDAFAPGLRERYFPGLKEGGVIDTLLAEDLNSSDLVKKTRPPGAPGLADVRQRFAEAESPRVPPVESLPENSQNPGRYRELSEEADRARGRGNVVRAAVQRFRAASATIPKAARAVRNTARGELETLADRLRSALDLSETDVRALRRLLPSLLPAAAHQAWPAERRLLYDLQKVCVDHERELFAADLVGWAASFGRRPIQRPLPGQREVLLLRHLNSARRRLAAARIPDDERRDLDAILRAAAQKREKRIRARFRPIIVGVFDEVGLTPQNLPEQVSRDRLVEELLDRIVERGFITVGDLRDGIARGQLKLSDLSGPKELVIGDCLIRADRKLATVLDGVYRRGEIYLRWLQRLSSLSFGTRPGRWLVRFFVIPFGGAYAVIEMILHLAREGAALLTGEKPHILHNIANTIGVETQVFRWELVAILGLFFLALLHSVRFRRLVLSGLWAVAHGLRKVFVELPAFLLRWPPLRRLLDSTAWKIFSYFVLKPTVPAVLVGIALYLAGEPPGVFVSTGIAVFLVANLVLNSRFGRAVEEVVFDLLTRAWHRLRLEIFPEFVSFVLDLFRQLLGAFDRLLYAVDEQLRYRGGQSRVVFVLKTLAGVIWFAVGYVLRANVVVWIEPTFNPIKHVPTVTVAAKILLPISLYLPSQLEYLGATTANLIATGVLIVLPGVAGFLVWELKENWRLYAASRSASLRPVPVGSHGETIVRLLRPGLHSGTLPKLFAKLRRTERRLVKLPNLAPTARRLRSSLHHVKDAVRHFLARYFLALLDRSTFWRTNPLQLGRITLSPNRITAEVCCPSLGSKPLVISFEEHSGWLLAGVNRPDWLARMSAEQRQVLLTALAGLYQLAGVDLVWQQIAALLPSWVSSVDVVEDGLALWSEDGSAEAIYPLEGETLTPRITAGRFPAELPSLPARLLFLTQNPIPWNWLVATWTGDSQGKPHPPLPMENVQLLPS